VAYNGAKRHRRAVSNQIAPACDTIDCRSSELTCGAREACGRGCWRRVAANPDWEFDIAVLALAVLSGLTDRARTVA